VAFRAVIVRIFLASKSDRGKEVFDNLLDIAYVNFDRRYAVNVII